MVVESTQLPLKVHNRIDQQKEKCCQNVNEHMTGRRAHDRSTRVPKSQRECASRGVDESNHNSKMMHKSKWRYSRVKYTVITRELKKVHKSKLLNRSQRQRCTRVKITLEKIMHEYTRSNECQQNYVCE